MRSASKIVIDSNDPVLGRVQAGHQSRGCRERRAPSVRLPRSIADADPRERVLADLEHAREATAGFGG